MKKYKMYKKCNHYLTALTSQTSFVFNPCTLTDIVTKRFHNLELQRWTIKRFLFKLESRIPVSWTKNFQYIAKHVERFPKKEKDLISSNEILQIKNCYTWYIILQVMQRNVTWNIIHIYLIHEKKDLIRGNGNVGNKIFKWSITNDTLIPLLHF